MLPRLETGGVERGTIDTAAAIAAAGWTALVASSGRAMVRELERAGARHLTLRVESKNPLVMRANVRRLAKLIGKHRRQSRPRPVPRAGLERARRGTPHRRRFHHHLPRRLQRNLEHQAPLQRDHGRGREVIAISNYIAERLEQGYGVPSERIRVVPRGIDIDLFSAASVSARAEIQLSGEWRLPDAAPVIMLPGRMTPLKGHDILVEALARLGRRDVRCLLVGAEQGRTRYRQEINDHVGARERLGDGADRRPLPRHAAAYMLADVVVSASTSAEGFGRVAVEAQAMGRPVIATDHGGARETVIGGETGWLVPPGDPERWPRPCANRWRCRSSSASGTPNAQSPTCVCTFPTAGCAPRRSMSIASCSTGPASLLSA